MSKEMTMANHEIAKIDPRAACLTLVNVYEVEPENQGDLARRLSELTDGSIRKQPGFISVSIHSSLDGKRVVNYAQWASKEHFEGFMKKPETQAQLKEFAALAKSVSPALYKVNSVHSG
jgi:quinol monooxygenase YgiN